MKYNDVETGNKEASIVFSLFFSRTTLWPQMALSPGEKRGLDVEKHYMPSAPYGDRGSHVYCKLLVIMKVLISSNFSVIVFFFAENYQ